MTSPLKCQPLNSPGFQTMQSARRPDDNSPRGPSPPPPPSWSLLHDSEVTSTRGWYPRPHTKIPGYPLGRRDSGPARRRGGDERGWCGQVPALLQSQLADAQSPPSAPRRGGGVAASPDPHRTSADASLAQRRRTPPARLSLPPPPGAAATDQGPPHVPLGRLQFPEARVTPIYG